MQKHAATPVKSHIITHCKIYIWPNFREICHFLPFFRFFTAPLPDPRQKRFRVVLHALQSHPALKPFQIVSKQTEQKPNTIAVKEVVFHHSLNFDLFVVSLALYTKIDIFRTNSVIVEVFYHSLHVFCLDCTTPVDRHLIKLRPAR